jgi:hypothetical protein
MLGGSVHTAEKNTEAFVILSKEVGPDANADRTKYMIMSRDQNSGQCHNMEIGNSSFEMVEGYKIGEQH